MTKTDIEQFLEFKKVEELYYDDENLSTDAVPTILIFGVKMMLIKSQSTGKYYYWPYCEGGLTNEVLDKEGMKIFLEKLIEAYNNITEGDIRKRQSVLERSNNLSKHGLSEALKEIESNLSLHVNQNNGYVYIIEYQDLYKIGYSRNIKQRLKTLKSQFKEMKLFAVFACEFPEVAEALLHKEFEECRVNGEWFDLDRIWITMGFEENYEKSLGYGFSKLLIYKIDNEYYSEICDGYRDY